jgi:hypothetical protein
MKDKYMNLKDLTKEIPFKWRVQSTNQYKATFVAYIDARDVMDLLDEVVGPENWKDEYAVVGGALYCKISIKIDGEWVGKTDTGSESNVEAKKGEASDAFKRAAVKWGIGRFLYSLGVKTAKTKEWKNKWIPITENGDMMFKPDDINNYCNGVPFK